MAFDPTATRSGSEFSTNPFYAGAWLCYINGIAVPIQGFTSNTGVWMIPQFQIQLVPDVSLMRLGYEDLVEVTVWFLDHWVDPTHPTWRLLCEGEIVGWQFSNVAGGRAMSFDCVAHMHVMQQLFFYFMTNVDDVVAAQDPSLKASGFATEGLSFPAALFHRGLSLTQPEAAALNTNAGDPATAAGNDQIKAPYEFLYNVIRGVISKEVPDEKRALPMMNFFARWARKTRFHNRFVRQPILEDATTLADRKGVFPIFEAARNDQALLAMERHTASQIANSGSVYSLIENVFKLVYMDISMNPAAACVQVTLDPTQDGKILRLLDDNAPLSDLRPVVHPATVQGTAVHPDDTDIILAQLEIELGHEPTVDEIPQALLTPQLDQAMREAEARYRGTPINRILPAADDEERLHQLVAFSRTFSANNAAEEYAAARHAYRMGDNRAAALAHYRTLKASASTTAAGILSSNENFASSDRDITDGDIRIAQEVARTGRVPTDMDQGTVQHYRDTVRLTGLTPDALATVQTGVQERRQRNLEAQAAREAQDRHDAMPLREGVDPLEPVRLAQYTVKPQALFAEVPAFNVVYPSMIDSWSLNEDYKAQPTRIYVNDSVMTRMLRAEGTNRELMLHALTVAYPAEAQAVLHHRLTSPNGMTVAGVHETGKNLLIWPEENFAGPKVGRQELPGWFQTMLQWKNSQNGVHSTETPGATGNATDAVPNLLPAPVRRGQVPRPEDFIAGSYQMPADILRASNALPPINYNGTEYEEHQALWSPGRPALSPNRFLVMLGQDLMRAFPGHIVRVEIAPKASRVTTGGRGDLHLVGRAADLIIPRVRHEVDHAHGDVVANWLAAHAAEIGIQFFVWANAGWHGNNAPGLKLLPYIRRRPDGTLDSPTNNHQDHIHLELNIAGSRGETPYFQRHADNRNINVEPATRIVERPATGTQPTLPTGGLVTGTVTPGVSEATRTQVNPVAIAEDEQFNKLFYLYTQYKYFQDRYMPRVAGARLKFAPQIVAGNPGILFDSLKTSFHMVGYVQALGHSASIGPTGSMSSSVSYTCTRTFPEFLSDVRRDAELFGRRVTSAPAEIIPEIRDTLQNQEKASDYYKALFYGNTDPPFGKPAAFNYMDALGMQRGEELVPFTMNEFTVTRRAVAHTGALIRANAPTNAELAAAREAIPAAQRALQEFNDRYDRSVPWWDRGVLLAPSADLNPLTAPGQEQRRLIAAVNAARTHYEELVQASQAAAQTALRAEPDYNPPVVETTSTRVEHNIEPNDELSPLPGVYSKAFSEYDTAMQLGARPICTLTQYIRFWHGGETLGALIRREIVQEPIDTFAYASVVGMDVNSSDTNRRLSEQKTATYYRRIYKLRIGPGTEPTEQQRGYTAEPLSPSTATSGLPADYPQTRADWDTALLDYGDRIRKIRFDR